MDKKTENGIEYLQKTPRAKLIYYSCIEKPQSLKHLETEWYPEQSNPLYQKNVKKELFDYKFIKRAFTGSGDYREKPFVSLLERIPDIYEYNVKDSKNQLEAEIINDFIGNKELFVKYLDQAPVKSLFSIKNLKVLFKNDPALLGKYAEVIYLFLGLPASIRIAEQVAKRKFRNNFASAIDKFIEELEKGLKEDYAFLVNFQIDPFGYITALMNDLKKCKEETLKIYIPSQLLFFRIICKRVKRNAKML